MDMQNGKEQRIKEQKPPIDPCVRTEIYYKKNEALKRQNEILDGKPFWNYHHGTKKKDEGMIWTSSERNKELIRQFQTHLTAKGSGQYRVAKVTGYCRRLCDICKKDLDKLSKGDIELLVAQINGREEWSEHTKSDYRRVIKQFFNWYEEDDPRLYSGDVRIMHETRKLYTYLHKEVKSKPKPKSLDYSTMLTAEEIHQVIEKGCHYPVEKALIAVLHESGCRVGELLGMRLRDFEQKERHAMIRVDGKTGERRVPIIQSVPYITQWLAVHPARDNKDALLWVSVHSGHFGKPFRWHATRKMMRRCFERAGLNKKSNHHWCRHSRSTLSAPNYSESVMCKMLGWELGSKQVKTYVHLGAEQIEDAFLKEHGITNEKPKTPDVQFCSCGAINVGTARYCFKCGNALNVAIMLEDEDRKKAAIDDDIMWFATTVMANPALRKQFEEHKAGKKGGAR